MIKGIRSNSSKKDLRDNSHKQVTFEADKETENKDQLRDETFGGTRGSSESKNRKMDLKAMAAQLPGPNYDSSGTKSAAKSENPWDK